MRLAAFLEVYGVAVVLFLAIDLVWLGFLVRGFYQRVPSVVAVVDVIGGCCLTSGPGCRGRED